MKRTYICIAALLYAHAAAADDSGWYVGAGLGMIHTPENSVLGVSGIGELRGKTDNDDSSWSIGLGYRLHRNFAAELGYVDLGEIHSNVVDQSGLTDARARTNFSAHGVTLSVLGTLPLGTWQPYLRAGVLFSNTTLDFSGTVGSAAFGRRVDADNPDPFAGVGIRYAATQRLQIYLDSTFFREVGEPETGQSHFLNTSLGVMWQF